MRRIDEVDPLRRSFVGRPGFGWRNFGGFVKFGGDDVGLVADHSGVVGCEDRVAQLVAFKVAPFVTPFMLAHEKIIPQERRCHRSEKL